MKIKTISATERAKRIAKVNAIVAKRLNLKAGTLPTKADVLKAARSGYSDTIGSIQDDVANRLGPSMSQGEIVLRLLDGTFAEYVVDDNATQPTKLTSSESLVVSALEDTLYDETDCGSVNYGKPVSTLFESFGINKKSRDGLILGIIEDECEPTDEQSRLIKKMIADDVPLYELVTYMGQVLDVFFAEEEEEALREEALRKVTNKLAKLKPMPAQTFADTLRPLLGSDGQPLDQAALIKFRATMEALGLDVLVDWGDASPKVKAKAKTKTKKK